MADDAKKSGKANPAPDEETTTPVDATPVDPSEHDPPQCRHHHHGGPPQRSPLIGVGVVAAGAGLLLMGIGSVWHAIDGDDAPHLQRQVMFAGPGMRGEFSGPGGQGGFRLHDNRSSDSAPDQPSTDSNSQDDGGPSTNDSGAPSPGSFQPGPGDFQ